MECAKKRSFDLTEILSRDALVASMRGLMSPSRGMDLVWAVDATGQTDVQFRYYPAETSTRDRR